MRSLEGVRATIVGVRYQWVAGLLDVRRTSCAVMPCVQRTCQHRAYTSTRCAKASDRPLRGRHVWCARFGKLKCFYYLAISTNR